MDRIKNEKRDDDGNVRVWWWPCVSVTLRRLFLAWTKEKRKQDVVWLGAKLVSIISSSPTAIPSA